MNVRARVPAIVLATLALGAGAAGSARSAPTLTIDPAHTSATFSVKHLTLTTVSGSIPIEKVTLVAGDGHALAQANATFDLTKIDTQVEDRDNDLRSDHWFDVAKYPDMTFTSTKISGTPDAMTIAGTLTFHGVTKPVTLAGKYQGTVQDSRGRTHVGYTATGTLDRTQWNLGTNFPPAIVGDDITITIELEAIET